MVAPSIKPDDAARHRRAIESLAAELHSPPEQVRFVYESELRRISAGARVTEFIVIFVRRSVRECLLCGGRERKPGCESRAFCPMALLEGASEPAGAVLPR